MPPIDTGTKLLALRPFILRNIFLGDVHQMILAPHLKMSLGTVLLQSPMTIVAIPLFVTGWTGLTAAIIAAILTMDGTLYLIIGLVTVTGGVWSGWSWRARGAV